MFNSKPTKYQYSLDTTFMNPKELLANVLSKPTMNNIALYTPTVAPGAGTHVRSVPIEMVATTIKANPNATAAVPANWPIKLNHPVKKDSTGLYFGRDNA